MRWGMMSAVRMPGIAINATVGPPPLPPRPQVPTRKRFGLPTWLIALIVACVLALAVLGALIAWGVGTGWAIFAAQAQHALQLQPAVREHIGTIREMDVDFVATGQAPGGEEFVFRLQGDRGNGRVSANFVSVGTAQEVITYGVLTLADGTRLQLEDQSSAAASDCADEDCDDEADPPTDGPLEDA